MQIITMINPVIMLNVNKISSAIDGSGTTSIPMIARITSGMPRFFASPAKSDCRNPDTSVALIFLFFFS
jgi:hypothetical protein